MIYVAIAREIWTRLLFHTNTGIGDAEPKLKGAKIVKSGEYRTDVTKSLPIITLVDLTARDVAGRNESRVTLFLKTDRKLDFVRMSPDESPALLDWVEMLQDAVETAPSTGAVDTRLTLHKTNGAPVLDVHGQPLSILSEDFTWDFRMSEITDLSYLVEIDIVFNVPRGNRGNRRGSPVPASAYQI